jgi:iron(III) transport system substrate-binding protein
MLAVLLALPAHAASVVVYTTQAREVSGPVFRQFTQETGIEVKAVHDGEAFKGAGLSDRLLAEKGRPRGDLFWSDEEVRTVQLVQAGVLDAASVTNFGHRQRQLVIRSATITNDFLPLTLEDLTRSAARGQVALGDPRFGIASSHFLALRQRLGEAAWERWCRALAANQPLLADDDAAVVRLVADGRALVGLAGSDAIRALQREGRKIMPLSLGAEDGLSIRNSAALVKGGPNPEAARKLLAFLVSPENLQHLVRANAIEPFILAENGELLCGDGGDMILGDWPEILKLREPALERMREIFPR